MVVAMEGGRRRCFSPDSQDVSFSCMGGCYSWNSHSHSLSWKIGSQCNKYIWGSKRFAYTTVEDCNDWYLILVIFGLGEFESTSTRGASRPISWSSRLSKTSRNFHLSSKQLTVKKLELHPVVFHGHSTMMVVDDMDPSKVNKTPGPYKNEIRSAWRQSTNPSKS